MADLIGRSLGRYHILEKLGEGGMATVYKAFDTKLERQVAVKVIHPHKQMADKFVKRFDREAKALAQLNHANIVRVIDYGEQDGSPYLVMEYVTGGTLKQKLGGRPMPWREAIRTIIPVAHALSAAHDQGIIHRDVKSSNILIAKNGDPMLSDFGVARMTEVEDTLELTGTGVGVGTPEYMSPEQAQGRQVDGRSDLYSLGVVLYEMCTGRKPFQAETPMAVVWKLASEPLPSPRQFLKDLPEEVEGLLLKALARSPSNRYQDMDAFAQACQRVLEGKSPGLRKPKLWLWGAGFLGLILLGITSIFVFQEISKGEKSPAFVPSSTGQIATELLATGTNQAQASSPIPSQELPFLPFIASFDENTSLDDVVWFEQNTPPCRYEQQEGYLLMDNEVSSLSVDCLLTVRSRSPIVGGDFTSFEGRIRMNSDHNGVLANQGLYLTTDSLQGGSWWTFCGVTANKPEGASLLMEVKNYGAGQEAELVQYGTAIYNKWYKVRIEVDWQKMEFRCLIDDQLFDSIIPLDGPELATAKYRFHLNAWRTPGSFASSNFDDIRIEP